jgi:hypothetical protein
LPAVSLAELAEIFADGFPPWLLEKAEADIVSFNHKFCRLWCEFANNSCNQAALLAAEGFVPPSRPSGAASGARAAPVCHHVVRSGRVPAGNPAAAAGLSSAPGAGLAVPVVGEVRRQQAGGARSFGPGVAGAQAQQAGLNASGALPTHAPAAGPSGPVWSGAQRHPVMPGYEANLGLRAAGSLSQQQWGNAGVSGAGIRAQRGARSRPRQGVAVPVAQPVMPPAYPAYAAPGSAQAGRFAAGDARNFPLPSGNQMGTAHTNPGPSFQANTQLANLGLTPTRVAALLSGTALSAPEGRASGGGQDYRAQTQDPQGGQNLDLLGQEGGWDWLAQVELGGMGGIGEMGGM